MNFGKKSATWFSGNEGGGSRAVWNFSENSSVFEGTGFPKVLYTSPRPYFHQIQSIHASVYSTTVLHPSQTRYFNQKRDCWWKPQRFLEAVRIAIKAQVPQTGCLWSTSLWSECKSTTRKTWMSEGICLLQCVKILPGDVGFSIKIRTFLKAFIQEERRSFSPHMAWSLHLLSLKKCIQAVWAWSWKSLRWVVSSDRSSCSYCVPL